jgi:hypothetical protein
MSSRRTQRGMTFWGLTFILGVLAFSLFIFFKLIPPYLESFKVSSALDSIARQPDFPTMSRGDIAVALGKRFEIDNISDVRLDKALVVETRGRYKVVRVKYENVVPVAGNLSILLDFDFSKETRSGD